MFRCDTVVIATAHWLQLGRRLAVAEVRISSAVGDALVSGMLDHPDNIARDSARDGLNTRARGLDARPRGAHRVELTPARDERDLSASVRGQSADPVATAPRPRSGSDAPTSCAPADNRVKDDRMNELSVARNATSAQTRDRCENR
jgi:hypothetical protein